MMYECDYGKSFFYVVNVVVNFWFVKIFEWIYIWRNILKRRGINVSIVFLSFIVVIVLSENIWKG